MKLQIEALDPLFFRDGRPFALGEETYAEGIFPPLPTTVRGAFRSHWMSCQLGQPNADKDILARTSNKLELDYFGLGVAGSPVFPAPLDLFFPGKDVPATSMGLLDKKTITSSCPSEVSHLFKAPNNGKTESVAGHLLETGTMKDYIDGKSPASFETKRLTDFSTKEHKIGIGRDNELHRTKDGLLFRLVANRFRDEKDKELCILLDLQGFDAQQVPISNATVMPLGGERRSVTIKAVDFSLPKRPNINGKHFKICLLTPALFDSWYPTHLLTDFKGLKLVAACIGKPLSVGGWDILKKSPKPMRRAVPTGSVYLMEAKDEEQANEIAEIYHAKSICQPADAREGFGFCFIAQPFDNQII
ncbi:MAG: type III-B CRISPR module-associated protein Cmr3 [Saprospiraceae bacterium]|nr:type III-B CRISPR module-associated protein Cmr3 [Saprospiraceae bacterium]MCF8249250.1 type III-B CRISPR module-associated protein Cmr3 [Saprospiraceae bacterium]MCF8281182.1 type III-B CRISPR module-associated protein Cmr3 [Bacteroidales bacterium]MCF8311473.1 type III-B CRISPR module-associated protein Cmr3 [Saprospiraceae bacterium]MCF8439869.1 type III-B CRISPR module-associated protein Cmr3 [Saprospiraceae bacterium]